MNSYICFNVDINRVVYCTYENVPRNVVFLKTHATADDMFLIAAWNCVSTDQDLLASLFRTMEVIHTEHSIFDSGVNSYEWRLKVAACRVIDDIDLVLKLITIYNFIK